MFMRITSFAVTLALLGACSPDHKIDKGYAVSGDSYRTEDASEAPRTFPDVSVNPPEPEVIVAQESPRTPDAPAPEPPIPEMAEPDDADANNKTAMEPVPIGGAYLTCRYQNGQTQGSDSYRMDCEVAPVKEVGASIVSAAIYKVDAKGNRSPLPILNQDLLSLKWTVQESVSTMELGQVQVVLNVPGLLSATLTTTVNSIFTLVQNSSYWLGGEPNSLNEDEDCVEFVSANGKLSHQSFSGLTSGPLGRMNDIGCTAIHSFLCRNISAGATAPKWTASSGSGPFTDGATACGQGYSFGFPLNTTEVREVMALVDARDIKIWVNMSDRLVEKTYAVKFR